MSRGEVRRPTLDEIKTTWPPTADVRPTALALGISPAHLYEAIKQGTAPVRTIRVGTRIKVVTSSIIALLDTPESGTAA